MDTVQDASALRGKLLYLARADLKLPADRYFIKDLIGMTIVDADSGHPLRRPDRRQRNPGPTPSTT